MRILFLSFAFLAVALSFLAWADSGTPLDSSVPPQNISQISGNNTSAVNARIDNNAGTINPDSTAGDPVVDVLITYKDKKIEERAFGFFRKKVDAVKDLENKVENSGGELDHVYKNFNLVAAEIKESEIDKLKKDKNIISVAKVSRLNISLAGSVPLVKADKVWQEKIYSANITGASISVCVLDTGIDIDHPDLSAKIIAAHCYCTASDKGSGGCCPNNMAEDTNADDDHGHGTHVAGIVAASGGVTGVAKGANLIPIKIANVTGTAEDADLVKAIDWCISNSTKYNITVISLSMGGDSYMDYCDSEPSVYPLKLAIDAAVAANISFVAATGNDGSSTNIAAPACLFNVTRVGSTTKSDTIPAYTNRGANFSDILLAPGSDISSTKNNGGYVSMSGTSMATPHVSGALAILSQAYLLKNGDFPSPSYLHNILNSTGKPIFDSGGSNINFSRIDILSALYYMGMPPRIMAQSNNMTGDNSEYISVNETNDIFFSIVTDQDVSYAWYKNSTYLGGSASNLTWGTNKTDAGTWNITVVISNTNGTGRASWIVEVNDTFLSPEIILWAPENHIYSNNQTIIFSYIPSDAGTLVNCSLYMNVSSNWNYVKYNESSIINGDMNNISFSIPQDSAYIWNIKCIDDDYMESFNSTNRTIFIDTTPPVPSILNPISANYTVPVSLNFTFNESNFDTCYYSLNSGDNTTISCNSNSTLPIPIQGQNSLIFCMNDSASNINCTSATFFYDSISPVISISEPSNMTYKTSVLFINITTGEDASACSYDLGDGNQTMNGSRQEFNASILAGDGSKKLSVYCTDMYGNIGVNDSLFFSVDTTPPIIEIVSPVEKTYSKLWVLVNVTTDRSDICMASLDGGDNMTLENQSIIPSHNWTANISIATEGQKNISVYCNDTAGNMNYSSVRFSVSISHTDILLVYPSDNVNMINSPVVFNYTPDGTDIASCTLFSNFSGVWSANESNSTPVISGALNSIVISSVPDSTYSWNIGCIDSFGNMSSAGNNYTFTLDSTLPNMTIISPLNSSIFSASTKWLIVNITTSENAECRYNISNASFDYQSGGTSFNITGGLNHSFNYSGLNPGTSYTLYYKCMDTFSNVNSVSAYHTFSTSLSCTDSDGDGYGVGSGCLGSDCDDSDAVRHASCSPSSPSDSSRSSIYISAPPVQINNSSSVKSKTETGDVNRSESRSITLDNITDDLGQNKTTGEGKSPNMTRKSGSQIFAEILEIKDIVSRMESEKKISGNEKEEYLSRLREVMLLYEAEKYDEAQLMAENVRASLSGNASISEPIIMSEYGFDKQLIYVFSIIAILLLFIIGHVIFSKVNNLENHKNAGFGKRHH